MLIVNTNFVVKSLDLVNEDYMIRSKTYGGSIGFITFNGNLRRYKPSDRYGIIAIAKI